MRKRTPDPIATVGRRAIPEVLLSPTSPLERNPRSPKGWKNRETDGVGLAIVAALEKSGGESPAKLVVNFHRISSPPIPISYAATSEPRSRGCEVGCTGRGCTATVSSCHGHGKRSGSSKGAFCDDGCEDGGEERWGELGFFCASPPRFTDDFSGYPVAGFLSSCYLCRKKLDGKDIYMYRGEKAFCSMECRYRQIVADEYQETCGYEASRPSDISSSVYSGGRLFYTGVLAS